MWLLVLILLGGIQLLLGAALGGWWGGSENCEADPDPYEPDDVGWFDDLD